MLHNIPLENHYWFYSKSYTILYPFGYIILSLSLAEKQTRIAALVHEYNLSFANIDKMKKQNVLFHKTQHKNKGK